MKKLILLFFVIHCSYNFGFTQWVQMINGMGNIFITSLEYKGNNLFAGTYPSTGVFLSTNNGMNWSLTSLNNQEIRSFAVKENYIFTGTRTNGVYFSTNDGINWTQTSLNNRDVLSLEAAGDYIFAGTMGNGIYFSTNNGTNWIQTSFYQFNVWSLASSGNRIYAGTTDHGVYLSSDSGSSWIQTSFTDKTVYTLAINGSNIYAGTGAYGVYKSTNNGVNWIQTSLNNLTIYSLAVLENNIFAGTSPNSGVFASTNNGANWIQRNEGLGSKTVAALCILNNYIFAGTYSYGVYRRAMNEIITDINNYSENSTDNYRLFQNYPNPFNNATLIKFQTKTVGNVLLKVSDIQGRDLVTLINKKLAAGIYEADWDASSYSSGVYYYSIYTENYSATKKMLLIK